MPNGKSDFKKHVSFENRMLILGFGAIGQCILPLILRHIKIAPSNITIIEAGDHSDLLNGYSGKINYVPNKEIDENNFKKIFSQYLKAGDFLVNVSVNISGIDSVEWCQKNGVLYVDTSIEFWEWEYDDPTSPMDERTYYHAHYRIRNIAKKKGTTAVVTHGANPGLVSHFAKAALIDVANYLGKKINEPNNKNEWAELSRDLGIKVIHISERDTQISSSPKKPGEFANTWSVEGFWAEGIGPAEMGWGTHETELPSDAAKYGHGPKNAIYFNVPGIDVLIRSWVPEGGNIHGYMLQHNEIVTLSEFLTLENKEAIIYRPSVSYCYLPCDAALASVHEMKMHEFEYPEVQRVMKDDLINGMDELGVLLLGHDANAWWYGSQLNIHAARELIGPGHNATILQVAAPLLGAIVWTIKNPNAGYCEPEDLPYREILEIANPYLGKLISIPSDWHPLKNRNILFPEKLNKENEWAFENFRVK